MVRMTTPEAELGQSAPDFSLPGVDGRVWTLDACRGERGTLVMFICNHCLYVKAILDRLVRDCRELREHGVNSVAIMSNDPMEYAEDSFDNMARIAREMDFPFPYLLDETQDVARAYGAVCTPDFFGYDADLHLQYCGRLDASRKESEPGAPRELFEVMVQVARAGRAPGQQWPSRAARSNGVKMRHDGGSPV